MLRLADSAAAHALREDWASSSVSLLESRLHTFIDESLPKSEEEGIRRAALVADATRLATARVLQVHDSDDAVLRYAASSDPSVRAAMEVVAPGNQPARVDIASAHATESPRAASSRAGSASSNRTLEPRP